MPGKVDDYDEFSDLAVVPNVNLHEASFNKIPPASSGGDSRSALSGHGACSIIDPVGPGPDEESDAPLWDDASSDGDTRSAPPGFWASSIIDRICTHVTFNSDNHTSPFSESRATGAGIDEVSDAPLWDDLFGGAEALLTFSNAGDCRALLAASTAHLTCLGGM